MTAIFAHPFKRVLTGLLLAGTYACIWFISTSYDTLPNEMIVASLVLAALLVVLSVVDIETYSLPDPLVGTLAVAGIVMCLTLGTGTLIQSSLAALVICLLVLAANRIYFRIRGRHGIGMGDAKLLAVGRRRLLDRRSGYSDGDIVGLFYGARALYRGSRI